ncbi:hypothetical protein BGW80DRAFT_126310 [Lactifluus volemus]|nr:hypothetical protein BGW80DRAFT_126310 [Lactifluus volemus]
MRLFKLLSLLSLFFWARASSLKTRQPASHPLDARQLSDVPVCAFVSSVVDITINACLCTSDSALQDFIESDPDPQLAAEIAQNTENDVFALLTSAILGAAQDLNCQYPDHSSPACVGQDPCGFTCTDGFTPFPPGNPTTCACKGDSVICNGQCVDAGSCPSSLSVKKKRWVGSGICAEMGPEWAACGVFGGTAHSWECINTARDLESCGGCMLPLTPYVPIGQDCTSLPGVSDVACIAGECVVQRCLPGYSVGRDGNHCVSRHGEHSEYDEDEAESVPARVYGLKHVPCRNGNIERPTSLDLLKVLWA